MKKTTQRILGPAILLVLLIVFAYQAYQVRYLKQGFEEANEFLKLHEVDIDSLISSINNLHVDSVFISDGTSASINQQYFSRNDSNFLENQKILGRPEYNIKKLVTQLYRTEVQIARYKKGSGFAFDYKMSRGTVTSLVHCYEVVSSNCSDRFFSKVSSIEPLKPGWWYVDGIFRDDWEK
jgi:hypothetical protein